MDFICLVSAILFFFGGCTSGDLASRGGKGPNGGVAHCSISLPKCTGVMSKPDCSVDFTGADAENSGADFPS